MGGSCGDALASTCGDDGTQTLLLLLQAWGATAASCVGAGVASHDGGDHVATNGLMEDTPVPGF